MALVVLGALFVVPVAAQGPEMVRVVAHIDKGHFNTNTVRGIGGKIVYEFKLIDAVVIDIPANAVGKLAKLDGVTKVEYDHMAQVYRGGPPWAVEPVQPAQTIPWGIERVKAPETWSITDGSSNGVIEVAVLDTGADWDHPDIAANIVWGVSTIGGVVSTDPADWYDGNGHGTHVIGTIAALNNDIGVVGVAPNVEIYAIKVLDDRGSGTYTDIAIGIEQALLGPDGILDKDGDGIVVGDPDDDAAEVISMSLGGPSDDQYLHDMIIQAYNYGVVIVAASGNEAADQPSYPAIYPEVIAVGATDSSDAIAYFSNLQPEVSAPGVDVLSTYPDDTYESLSGTSMATPHVSGVVALIQAAYYNKYGKVLPVGTFDDMGTNTVRGILHSTADDLGDAGWDIYYGYGIVRADLAVQAAIG
ncbi:subtilisin-like serine protease [Thermococcus cleftensis]|uniref:Subtilisin-like serine protease n=2 Tax=Thermococcus cleftensis (strain DSM 27260 / KACC 17922 / CL1) TaxID=163003 RepID=I3ZTD4_THECF|nr:subtilisin-like serine protease [Thermococcus cleftensis]